MVEEINKNYRKGIPECYIGADPKNLVFDLDLQENKRKFENIRNWFLLPQGNLLFHGEPGRSKTYTAICCMYQLEFYNKIKWEDMRYVNVPELNQLWLSNLNNMSENYNILLKLQEIEVLVLDDIGIRKPSDGFLDFLHCLIDKRINKKNSINIYTTNLNAEEFNNFLGSRLVSRIASGLKIHCNGPDFRYKPNNR